MVRNKTKIGRKTSFYSRNILLLWSGSWFTKCLLKYQLSSLQPHEVGRKIIISIFLGLRKPRLSEVDRWFSLALSHSQLLFSLLGTAKCPTSLRHMSDLKSTSIPSSRRSCPDCAQVWLWQPLCSPWNATLTAPFLDQAPQSSFLPVG